MDEQRYSQKLDELLSKMSLNVAQITKKLSGQVLDNVKQGMTVSKAVDKALSVINFTTAFQEAAVAAIFEAACAGYGIDPKMVADEEGIKKVILSDSWAPDKKLLSTRIHGMSDEVRQNIVDELTSSMKRHASVIQAARELFSGYGYGTHDSQTYLFEDGEPSLKKITGKDAMQEAKLPQYLSRLKESAEKAINDPAVVNDVMKEAQKSAKILQQNSSNMAPTKALKAAYSDLIKAAQMLNEQALERAAKVAVQERTRYYAERIARTEMARAAHDGFLAKYQDDDLVVAYKWVLSSRHKFLPFDQCDVCKNADVGYGPGIYPKDKVPSIPRHPHCMCRLVPVYRKPDGEFNPDGAKDYIDSLSDSQWQSLFGVDGAKAYASGADWQDKLRGWDGFSNDPSRFDTGLF